MQYGWYVLHLFVWVLRPSNTLGDIRANISAHSWWRHNNAPLEVRITVTVAWWSTHYPDIEKSISCCFVLMLSITVGGEKYQLYVFVVTLSGFEPRTSHTGSPKLGRVANADSKYTMQIYMCFIIHYGNMTKHILSKLLVLTYYK